MFKSLLKLVQLLVLLLPFPQACSPSNGVFVKIKDPTVGVKSMQKSVLVVADQMVSHFYFDLDELKADLKQETSVPYAERQRRMAALAIGRKLVDHGNVNKRKIQIARTEDGRQQFAVNFMGDSKIQKLFMERRDQGRIGSLGDLARMLEEVHRDVAFDGVELKPGMRIKPNEFHVTDGKEIYSIYVGRTRGDSGLREDLKQPKIRRRKGNLYVDGWVPRALKADLAGTFAGQRGLFGLGKRKRARISLDEAHERITQGLAVQASRYGVWPNAVSVSNSAYNMRAIGQPQVLEYNQPEERRVVNSMLEKELDEIVEQFVRNRWMRSGRRWQNPWLNEAAEKARRTIAREQGGLYGRGRGMEPIPRVPQVTRIQEGEARGKGNGRRKGLARRWANKLRSRVGRLRGRRRD